MMSLRRRNHGLSWCAAAWLCLATTGWAQDKVTLAVWPEKILYDVGETAKFEVTVTNGTAAALDGTLTVQLCWGMEDSQQLLQQPFTAAAGRTEKVTATWTTVEVLGCEVRATLARPPAEPLTAAEYFNVCRSRDAQRVGIHVEYPDLFTYNTQDYFNSIPAKVMDLRRGYGNIVEHFGWCPDNYAELAPQREEWCSNYWQSKTAIRKAIEEEHKHGMKVLHYAAGYLWSLPGAEMMRRHPDWVFYRENGQPWSGGVIDVRKLDYERNPKQETAGTMAGGGLQGVFPNFALKSGLEYGVRQLIDSKKMFGWDGVRFDGHYLVWSGICPGARDIHGKLIPAGKEADELNRFNTDYTRKTVSAVFPDYLFMFNASVKDADIAEICRDGGAPANEPIRESMETTSQYHTWKAFTQYMLNDADTARKLGGYAYDYLNPPFPGCVVPNVDRIQYPLMFAAGCHPWFSFPGRDLKVDHGGSHFPIQRDLFRLATRYSAVLWGHGIDRVRDAAAIVEVTSPKNSIWWQDFVYARKLADGRMQWVVHLINEPPSQNIERNSQELPQPQSDIPVKFKVPAVKVWALRAEPQLEVRPLTVTTGGVTVPQLGIWTVVVAEEAKR